MPIEVRNLSKHYGEHVAVRDLSFEARRGEILGFLGPNGAGKTTTMKIITCYMPPTSGTVTVEGFDTASQSLEVRRTIGYLPEMNPLYLDMSVDAYLEYAAALHGLRGQAAASRIREMIRVCGLETVHRMDIGELSKGFRQRVGLAQAMVHDPPVLILDEPTSGLDPNQIVEIRNLIRELGRAKTVVLSTHILSEVQATCDRVLIINEGSIVADGTPQQLQRQFQGSELVTLQLKTEGSADPQDIAARIRSLPHVAGVTLLDQGNPLVLADVEAASGTDVREELFRLAVAERWVILEMHRKAASLEEVFHKLTTS